MTDKTWIFVRYRIHRHLVCFTPRHFQLTLEAEQMSILGLVSVTPENRILVSAGQRLPGDASKYGG